MNYINDCKELTIANKKKIIYEFIIRFIDYNVTILLLLKDRIIKIDLSLSLSHSFYNMQIIIIIINN